MAEKKPTKLKRPQDLDIGKAKGGCEAVKGGVKKSAPCKKGG